MCVCLLPLEINSSVTHLKKRVEVIDTLVFGNIKTKKDLLRESIYFRCEMMNERKREEEEEREVIRCSRQSHQNSIAKSIVQQDRTLDRYFEVFQSKPIVVLNEQEEEEDVDDDEEDEKKGKSFVIIITRNKKRTGVGTS